jgi:hypothetical protein
LVPGTTEALKNKFWWNYQNIRYQMQPENFKKLFTVFLAIFQWYRHLDKFYAFRTDTKPLRNLNKKIILGFNTGKNNLFLGLKIGL